MKTNSRIIRIAAALPLFVMSAASQVAIAPHSPASGPGTTHVNKRPIASVPVLGYVPGIGPTDIYPILGVASKPQLGAKMILPSRASRVYLPPRQQYALVETRAGNPVAVWNLAVGGNSGEREIVVPGAISAADLVSFSPAGEAAVLYSAAAGRLQVIGKLPSEPALLRELSTGGRGGLSRVAVTDDGTLVVAEFADGIPLYSLTGSPWQFVATSYRPVAWTFAPHRRHLIFSDASEKSVLLFPDPSASVSAPRVVTNEISADYLSFTKDGDVLLAGSSARKNVLQIDLASGTVSHIPGDVNALTQLRDGRTFLLSAFPTVSLLKAAALDAASAPAPSGPEIEAGGVTLSH